MKKIDFKDPITYVALIPVFFFIALFVGLLAAALDWDNLIEVVAVVVAAFCLYLITMPIYWNIRDGK